MSSPRQRDHAGYPALVVKNGAELVGVVTEMDLPGGIVRHDDLDATKVARLMTSCELITAKAACSPCVQLDENEKVRNALATMHKAGTHHLLVAGAGNKAGSLREHRTESAPRSTSSSPAFDHPCRRSSTMVSRWWVWGNISTSCIRSMA